METQKKYKHKQTGAKAIQSDINKNMYKVDRGCSVFSIHKDYIENTSDWELIPETPKMEVVEGLSSYNPNGSYHFINQTLGISNTEKLLYNIKSILITSPTPEMKQIIEAVKNKKAYEYFVGSNCLKQLESNGNLGSYWAQKNKPFSNSVKILIIPIEEETK